MDDAWGAMADTRRRNIRRAEKDGVSIDMEAQFEDLWGLVEETFRRQGMRVGFSSSAHRANELLSGTGKSKTLIARDESGKAIAGVYICWDWNRAYYLLGGYDTESSHHGGSALALWHAMRFAGEEAGLRAFDFEGSMVPAIERFFRKFGGVLTPYFEVVRERPLIRWARNVVRLIR